MKPSQNFFWGAFNERSPVFQVPLAEPGWAIEYHIAASADFESEEGGRPPAGVRGAHQAVMPRQPRVERMSVSSGFHWLAFGSPARVASASPGGSTILTALMSDVLMPNYPAA